MTHNILAMRQKVPSFWRNFPQIKRPFSINEKRPDCEKIAPKLMRLKLNSTNSKPKHSNTHLNCTKKPDPSISYGLKVKNKTIRVLLDAGLSGDLLFVKKGSIQHISIVKVKQAVPQLWGTTNGTFNTDKVGDIEISFVEYSTSKKVCFQLDIVE
jgi:hypothetical protein